MVKTSTIPMTVKTSPSREEKLKGSKFIYSESSHARALRCSQLYPQRRTMLSKLPCQIMLYASPACFAFLLARY